MRLWILIALLCGAFVLTACQPTRVLNTVVPSGSYNRLADVPYATDSRQQMDIYIPSQKPLRENIIVFVYGGAWDQGDKNEFEFVGQAFARLGYVTVIPNYRLYPDVEFPQFIDDIAKAIAALPEHLNEPCPSPDNLILMGHSAGAHSVAMLVADPRYFDEFVPFSPTVHALIGMSGPYDLPLEHERVKDKFTTVEGDEANPVALAHENMPRTLLLHGGSDTIAAPEHTEKFAARLAELNVPVETRMYERARHVALVASLASPLRFWTPAYNDIQEFFELHQLNEICAPESDITN